jgi:hypothetical protein
MHIRNTTKRPAILGCRGVLLSTIQLAPCQADKLAISNPVGASLLAMVVNDDAGSLTPRGVLTPIASKLAPTQYQDF